MEEFEIHLIYELLNALELNRVMVDVGANRGMSLWRFAGSDYRVFAFEPNPDIHAELMDYVKDHPNVHVDGRAVTNRNGEEVPLYTGASLGTSTLSPFYAQHRPTAKVQTVTLDAFCAEQSIDDIDFVKIDAEGFDLYVLEGMPWRRIRPAALLVEFQNPVTQRLGYGFHDIAKFLVARDYRLLISEWYPIGASPAHPAIWRRFARYPSELMDESAWGNMFAIRDEEAFERLAFAAQIAEGFIAGADEPNDPPPTSEAAIARKAAAVAEQVAMIGVYMTQYAPH